MQKRQARQEHYMPANPTRRRSSGQPSESQGAQSGWRQREAQRRGRPGNRSQAQPAPPVPQASRRAVWKRVRKGKGKRLAGMGRAFTTLQTQESTPHSAKARNVKTYGECNPSTTMKELEPRKKVENSRYPSTRPEICDSAKARGVTD
jgi:hypothetical protein